MILKTIIFIISTVLLFTLNSCGGKQSTENTSDTSQEEIVQDEADVAEDQYTEVTEEKKFYELKFIDKGIFEEEVEIEKVKFTTIQSEDLGISRILSFEFYEPKSDKYTSFGFMFSTEKDAVKVLPGKYNPTPFLGRNEAEKLSKNEVYLMGAIDMKIYETALEKDLMDQIQDYYVILEDKENLLEIESSDEVDSDKEHELASIGESMIIGQQSVKGNFNLNLLDVNTKKEFQIKIQFDVIHDWGYMDEEKLKEDTE